MIRKIRSISNMGVYPSFVWRDCARDAGNNELFFDQVNVIYGRNYSGKTTLSRVVRALQTGLLSEKYPEAEYCVELGDRSLVTQDDPSGHGLVIRVFNEDFVRDHLGFIVDPESDVVSFAVVGAENNEIEALIAEKERVLGSVEGECGLLHDVQVKRSAWSEAHDRHTAAKQALQSKLTGKATGRESGIKYNSVWGDPSYDRTKLERDIDLVLAPGFISLPENQVAPLERLLGEVQRDSMDAPSSPVLRLEQLSAETRELVERKVRISRPIQDLIEDAALAEWVHSGRAHHEGKRTTCGFCGATLPDDLWDKLTQHFNEESENLRDEIDACRQRVMTEMAALDKTSLLNGSALYAQYASEVPGLQLQLNQALDEYKGCCQMLVDQLNARQAEVAVPRDFSDVQFDSDLIERPYERFRDLVRDSNAMSSSLGASKQDARRLLKLKDVATFAAAIDYPAEVSKIAELAEAVDQAQKNLLAADELKSETEREVVALRSGLTDETGAAMLANRLLGDYFGHDGLAFKPVEVEDGVRFEIVRGGERAYHLSEGEKTLVAFCYFIAKLEDVETAGTKPVVWIDDPVSSLDGNHVFYLFSLIRTRLVPGESIAQLVISTHSLDFLKYLMELPGKDKKLFMLERGASQSRLLDMPKYLRNYVTEFNYLFEQVYRCSVANTDDELWEDSFYSFGNNVRKFLEIYLYYRYPDGINQENCFYDKVKRFLGDDEVATAAARRIANEYSHLRGTFERASAPVDVPEMKKIASLVVARVESSDPDQYESLLKSIGIEAA